ncbi:MAG: hypothetical protein HOJ68_12330 [Bacteroidetes bacterium]|jgi:ABC-type glutathione transport system ATPase component|nr:hypothetical protein [Bacteroidota bacterium]
MNNVKTAIAAIQKTTDRNELNEIIAAVKLQQTYLAKTSARKFSVGEAVTFKGRAGRTVVGTVFKVNPKTIVVDTPTTRWKVTASMLSSLEA